MGILNFLGLGKKEDPDSDKLAKMEQAGADLSQPHIIEFYVYFPSQFTAEKAAIRIKKGGFHTSIVNSRKGDWLCQARKKMVPQLSEFKKFREEFGHIIETYSGRYGGWKAKAEG